jgi:hypothetical protein
MSSKTKFAPRSIAGNAIITQEVVRNDGSIAQVTIEQYDMSDVQGFMFIVNGCTNRVLYTTARKAINASAKTTV